MDTPTLPPDGQPGVSPDVPRSTAIPISQHMQHAQPAITGPPLPPVSHFSDQISHGRHYQPSLPPSTYNNSSEPVAYAPGTDSTSYRSSVTSDSYRPSPDHDSYRPSPDVSTYRGPPPPGQSYRPSPDPYRPGDHQSYRPPGTVDPSNDYRSRIEDQYRTENDRFRPRPDAEQYRHGADNEQFRANVEQFRASTDAVMFRPPNGDAGSYRPGSEPTYSATPDLQSQTFRPDVQSRPAASDNNVPQNIPQTVGFDDPLYRAGNKPAESTTPPPTQPEENTESEPALVKSQPPSPVNADLADVINNTIGEPLTVRNRTTKSKLQNLRKSQLFADVVFMFRGGKEIWAHKALVCEYSSYVLQLCSTMRTFDAQQTQSCVMVDIEKIDSSIEIKEDILNMALDFIYGEPLKVLPTDMDDLVWLSQKLHMPDLHAALLDTIKANPDYKDPKRIPVKTEMISNDDDSATDIDEVSPKNSSLITFGTQTIETAILGTTKGRSKRKKTIPKRHVPGPGRPKRNAKSKFIRKVKPPPVPVNEEGVPIDEEGNVILDENGQPLPPIPPQEEKPEEVEEEVPTFDEEMETLDAELGVPATPEPDPEDDPDFSASGYIRRSKRKTRARITGSGVFSTRRKYIKKDPNRPKEPRIRKRNRKPKEKREGEPKSRRKNKCNKCMLQHATVEDLYNHKIQVHHLFGCELCKRCFDAEDMLKIHQLTHSGLNPYVTDDGKTTLYHCDKCPETCFDSLKLNRHRRDAHGLNKLICNMCDAALSNTHYQLFSKHLYYTHYFDGKGCFECDICGKFHSNEEALKRHKVIHETRTFHQCKVCGQTFTMLANLKIHQELYGDKPHVARNRLDQTKKTHQCVHCGLKFARDAHVKRHILTQHSNAEVVEAVREEGRKRINVQRKSLFTKRHFPGYMPKPEGETSSQGRARRRANKKIKLAQKAAIAEAREANARSLAYKQSQLEKQKKSNPPPVQQPPAPAPHVQQNQQPQSLPSPLPTQVPIQRPIPPPMHQIHSQMPPASMPLPPASMPPPTHSHSYSHTQLGGLPQPSGLPPPNPMHNQISIPMHSQRPEPPHAHSSSMPQMHVNMEQYYGGGSAPRDIFNYFKL
ncbi:unnamed protein product [Owenia fusiformis]|uniref:Uncharacterized protein n=1 Tax=Owenia fusiformis TaxID=6347 RepID=A0A8J1U5C5_OWEFU|nr:unnamed protein product [Owenia fusiformis]